MSINSSKTVLPINSSNTHLSISRTILPINSNNTYVPIASIVLPNASNAAIVLDSITTSEGDSSLQSRDIHLKVVLPFSKSSQSSSLSNCHYMITRSKAHFKKPKGHAYLTTHSILTEPKTPSEALSIPKWKTTMTKEYQALLRNNTWEFVPATPKMNVADANGFSKLN